MATTTKLREQRASAYKQWRELIDLAEAEDRDLTAEERQSADRAEASMDELESRILRLEKAEALDKRLDQIVDMPGGLSHDEVDPQEQEDRYSDAFGQFIRFGMADMTSEGRQVMAARRITDKGILNAAGVGSGGAGGYTVPPAFRAVMVETMKAYGVMLQEAEFVGTDSGANLPWPTNDDTGNVGAILGENTAVSEQDLTFGNASLDAYMFTSKLVRASLQFLQDSNISEQWLARKLGERIGRILSQMFTTGTGTNQPDGLVTSATSALTGTGSFASTGGVSYDNLVDLQESLDPAYGSDPNNKWMAHQTVRKAIRKLKDTTGKPIWEPSVQVGAPDALMGRPFVVNNDMATFATSSKSLGYGNIKAAYVTRFVNGSASLLRLTERYADYLQVGFLAFERWDGTLQDANAFKLFTTTGTA